MTFREKLPNLSEILENKKAWVGFFFFSCGEGRRGGKVTHAPNGP